jgi:hypothetical protein
MPDRHGKLADVRPAYGRGDRVLVKLPLCYYVLVIHASDIIDGELWFYGRGVDVIMPFPAACIVRRLAPGEAPTRPGPT